MIVNVLLSLSTLRLQRKTGLCQIVYVISPHTRMFHGTKVATGKTKTSPISEVITLQENLAYVPIENMFLA